MAELLLNNKKFGIEKKRLEVSTKKCEMLRRKKKR